MLLASATQGLAGYPACCFGTCTDDCNDDGQVTITDLVQLVRELLNGCQGTSCCSPRQTPPTITDVLNAVNDALVGCPVIPTPTPIHYQLTEGSILVSSPEPPSPASVVTEPLIGTFDLVPQGGDPQPLFDITALHFSSQRFQIEGTNVGGVGALPPKPVVDLGIKVNVTGIGNTVLQGRGPYHVDTHGNVVFDGVPLCVGAVPPTKCPKIGAGTEAGLFLKMFASPTQ
jgi:hypothetical protein